MDVCTRQWQYRNSPHLKVSRAGLSWSHIRVSMAQEHRFGLVLFGSNVHWFHEVTRIRKSVNHTFQACGREHQAGRFTKWARYRLRCWQQAFLNLGLVGARNLSQTFPGIYLIATMFEYIQRWPVSGMEGLKRAKMTWLQLAAFYPLHVVEDQQVCFGSHGFFSLESWPQSPLCAHGKGQIFY